MYQQMIVDATGCSDDEAAAVEDVMRMDRSGLDGLSRSEFRREARISFEVVRLLAAEGQ